MVFERRRLTNGSFVWERKLVSLLGLWHFLLYWQASRMFLLAPKAAPEAELKWYLPGAQAPLRGLQGFPSPRLPFSQAPLARPGLGPSFRAPWVLSLLGSLTPCSKQDWKTPPGLALILCWWREVGLSSLLSLFLVTHLEIQNLGSWWQFWVVWDGGFFCLFLNSLSILGRFHMKIRL